MSASLTFKQDSCVFACMYKHTNSSHVCSGAVCDVISLQIIIGWFNYGQ